MDNTQARPTTQVMLDPRTLRLSITSIRTWASPDGGGYSCKLFLDGKLAGTVYNDGNGGSSAVDFGDPLLRQSVYSYVDELPWTGPHQYFPDGLKRDLDWVLSELLDWAERIKQFKRWRKLGVIYYQVLLESSPDLPEGEEWDGVKCPSPTHRDDIKMLVRKKHGIDGKKVIFADDFC